MKVVKGFAFAGVTLCFIIIHLYLLGELEEDILGICIVTLLVITLNFGIWYFIDASINKEIESIKWRYNNKGAEDILNQMYDDPQIQEYMKQRVPLINAKGEEYGSTSLWGKIRDFKDKGYNPNKNIN